MTTASDSFLMSGIGLILLSACSFILLSIQKKKNAQIATQKDTIKIRKEDA